MAVFRIHLANGEGRIESDLKAADEVLERLYRAGAAMADRGFQATAARCRLIDNLCDGWGERAKADAELAQLLKPYVFVQTIEGIDILRRVD
jgi:hypothetical protein